MQQYYLGADVSKGYADFVILDSKKQPVEKNFQMDDTFSGHCQLYDRLDNFYQNHPDSKIYAAVESTGGYENNWFNSLIKFQSSFDLETARLNPLGVHANSKADLKRNVTDKISAQNVAEFLIAHSEKVSYQQEDYLASLRKQWGFIKMLTKQSTQLLNQIEPLIYSANPELLVYCKDGMPGWILKLLLRYPTASNLSKAKASSVAGIPYVSSARAKELVNTAKQSVASSTDRITGQMIVATAKQILHLKKTIASQTKIMAKDCSLPEVDLLKTFSGINELSAIGLMIEIQSVERFSSVIRSNPLIREIYQDRVQKGMEKMAAIGLCMHKILRIIYGMLKHNRAFDPEVDRKNREKMAKGHKKVRQDKNRRYQGFDPKAPISRRQKMKRKEWEQSHSDNNTKSGIIAPIPASA